MDWMFGTYRCPDHEPESFGIREPIAQNYLGQMLHPFLRRRKSNTAATAVLATSRPLETADTTA
jgi:hypothetical protein